MPWFARQKIFQESFVWLKMFRALLLCSSILPSDRPIVWQTCINTSKPALHGFKYLQRSGQEGSFLVLTVSKSFSVIPWFSRTVSAGGLWDAVAVVWLWHREGIIGVGERPETMAVMMLMVLIKHLYFRYCGMCFTQMVTFDSHNDPRVIDFLFYRWGHRSLTKLRFPFKVYTASSGRATTELEYLSAAWHAAVHGIVKNQTWLSNWTTIWVQGATEDEMVGWHHWLKGHEFEWALAVGVDREDWRATVHGFAKSRIRLSDWKTITIWVQVCTCDWFRRGGATQMGGPRFWEAGESGRCVFMPPGNKVECWEGPTEAKRAQSPFSSAPEISVVSEQTLCWAVLVLSRSVVSDSLWPHGL